ncbi:MAG: iron transporter FeoB [Desulfitibacter sp. BRH_c19]|nr:MAG: iron transporter FeoB [Desulfitibacter sp. BRH_c19]
MCAVNQSHVHRSLDEITKRLDGNYHKSALRDKLVNNIYKRAETISKEVVTETNTKLNWERKIDDILTSKFIGFPIMLTILALVFWITLEGAEYPANVLYDLFFWIEENLTKMFFYFGSPDWLHGFIVLGVYRTLAWVIAVMLPPMAIFFPLFTLLEDFGYLPRVAFNLDKLFRSVGAHGKQSLTMSMGFGCNAAGVIACRIIDSPRERIIAILTNNFVPCNGRFPTLIVMATIFLGGVFVTPIGNFAPLLTVIGMILIGIIATLLVSWMLSKTLLRGIPSAFTLELPPYRKPQILQVIIRSLFDRTLFVLMRAIKVAAPAGAIVWILANIYIGDFSLLSQSANHLDPFAKMIGLDGMILIAFILGLPANEIVLPILIMGYLAEGAMLELDSLLSLKTLLVDNGWTLMTALSFMLFSLLHYPCGTTLLTIHKETQSLKWMVFAGLMHLVVAIIVLFILNQLI